MKKFQFKMQSLLKLREQELEAWQLKMAQEQHKVILLDQQHQNAQQQIETIMDSTIDSPFAYEQRLQFIGYLRDQQAQISHKKAEQQQVIELIQVEVTTALARKKTLEKLKEKQQKQHQAHWQKKEQDALEEIAINRYYAKQLIQT